MNITIVSNFLTHHQIPVCDALYQKCGEGFHFISTGRMEQERIKMGWGISVTYPYVLCAYESGEAQAEAERILARSDVVISGACSDEWLEKIRLSNAKVHFLYSERIFKKGAYQRFGPGAKRYRIKMRQLMQAKEIWFLCASAYLPGDLKWMGLGKDRCLRWGYFPDSRPFSEVREQIKAKKPSSILWAGRFLDWKHPEDAVYLAEKLRRAGYDFSLDIIGDGEMRDTLQGFIDKNNLQKQVRILGFLPPEEVREHMLRTDIYLFTSDRSEGWGAVLNESMNAGCAVVANREIGSVPYLIRNGENGMIYNRKRSGDLFRKVRFLLDHPEQKALMQREAYETISTLWNAGIAAERLMEFAEGLQDGREVVFENGPCSKANIL